MVSINKIKYNKKLLFIIMEYISDSNDSLLWYLHTLKDSVKNASRIMRPILYLALRTHQFNPTGTSYNKISRGYYSREYPPTTEQTHQVVLLQVTILNNYSNTIPRVQKIAYSHPDQQYHIPISKVFTYDTDFYYLPLILHTPPQYSGLPIQIPTWFR